MSRLLQLLRPYGLYWDVELWYYRGLGDVIAVDIDHEDKNCGDIEVLVT